MPVDVAAFVAITALTSNLLKILDFIKNQECITNPSSEEDPIPNPRNSFIPLDQQDSVFPEIGSFSSLSRRKKRIEDGHYTSDTSSDEVEPVDDRVRVSKKIFEEFSEEEDESSFNIPYFEESDDEVKNTRTSIHFIDSERDLVGQPKRNRGRRQTIYGASPEPEERKHNHSKSLGEIENLKDQFSKLAGSSEGTVADYNHNHAKQLHNSDEDEVSAFNSSQENCSHCDSHCDSYSDGSYDDVGIQSRPSLIHMADSSRFLVPTPGRRRTIFVASPQPEAKQHKHSKSLGALEVPHRHCAVEVTSSNSTTSDKNGEHLLSSPLTQRYLERNNSVAPIRIQAKNSISPLALKERTNAQRIDPFRNLNLMDSDRSLLSKLSRT